MIWRFQSMAFYRTKTHTKYLVIWAFQTTAFDRKQNEPQIYCDTWILFKLKHLIERLMSPNIGQYGHFKLCHFIERKTNQIHLVIQAFQSTAFNRLNAKYPPTIMIRVFQTTVFHREQNESKIFGVTGFSNYGNW